MLRVAILLVGLCLAAPTARAHPHVFVDVGLELRTDARGRLLGVEVTWRYDALFSMLILSDRGLDADGDMLLDAAEQELLIGFDLSDWPEGFEGALFVEDAGGKVALGPPEALSLALSDGRLVTRHFRPVAAPGPLPRRLWLRPFDPSYYAALELTGEVGLPEGCTGAVARPDRTAADALVARLGGPDDESLFEEVEVGIHYADTLEVACAPRS